MNKIKVKGKSGECEIIIDKSINGINDYIPKGKCVIITDSNVLKNHRDKFPEADIIEIGIGEKIKTLDTIENIYSKFLDLGIDRSSFVIGIGGGIVTDITGFVASTYLRGIKFGFVPTTFLAQIDACIGGKNGVNYNGYKNIIGTINQPKFVLCDVELLKTLPKEDLICGFAEIIKHAMICDKELFSYLEENIDNALNLEKDVIEKLINDSILIKVNVVNMDEAENWGRMKLNWGHTIGHAIEKIYGIPHGKTISIGMIIESRISVARGLMNESDVERLIKLLNKAGLPTEFKIDKEKIADAIEKDKKSCGEKIRIPVVKGIGDSVIIELEYNELKNIIYKL